MKQRVAFVAGVVALVMGAATDAWAQGLKFADNIFVNVNFGAQTRAQDDASHFGLELFLETGSVDIARTVKGGSFIDITAGATPLGPLGLAFNFMQRTAPGDGALTASVPSPFFYDSPQVVSGPVTALQHKETWFAVLLAYQIPNTVKALRLVLLAGPAVCVVEHEVVTDISVDAASGQVSASLAMLSRDLLGFQAGADATWLFTKHLGAGGYARYNSAKGHLGASTKAELGGLQFGGGVRLRF